MALLLVRVSQGLRHCVRLRFPQALYYPTRSGHAINVIAVDAARIARNPLLKLKELVQWEL